MFIDLYISIRNTVLLMMLKYGIKKHARSAWHSPANYDQVCTVIKSLHLDTDREIEAFDYLFCCMKNR